MYESKLFYSYMYSGILQGAAKVLERFSEAVLSLWRVSQKFCFMLKWRFWSKLFMIIKFFFEKSLSNSILPLLCSKVKVNWHTYSKFMIIKWVNFDQTTDFEFHEKNIIKKLTMLAVWIFYSLWISLFYIRYTILKDNEQSFIKKYFVIPK